MILDMVKSFFTEGFVQDEIAITEIQLSRHYVVVVLEDRFQEAETQVLIRSLYSFAGRKCLYLYEREVARPRTVSSLRTRGASQFTSQAGAAQHEPPRQTEIALGGKIFFNIGGIGTLEGTRWARSLVRDDSAVGGPEAQWAECYWEYMGQETSNVLGTQAIRGVKVKGKDGAVSAVAAFAPVDGVLKDFCLTVKVA
ncbi:hypothetical protein BJX70DRAFT_397736 [Aspergillus crustosus]